MRPVVREGAFAGDLPYIAVGGGQPLVYLCGGTPNHRNPARALERRMTLRTVLPLAREGYEVFFTNRWPGMRPDITWPEVAEVHAVALTEHFGRPVNVLGHSTGGSLGREPGRHRCHDQGRGRVRRPRSSAGYPHRHPGHPWRQDYFWSLDMFAETAYRMPHGRLVMYPDLGHGLVTSPRFVAVVVAFLSGSPSGSG